MPRSTLWTTREGRTMPDEEYKPTHTLVDLLVGLRARGLTWAQIETETEIDAERAATLVQEYLTSNYGASTVAEQRMLQLRRLEQIANALWDQVMAGDRITEGKQTKNMVHTLPLSGTPEEMRSAFRVRLESGFSQIYAEASARALEGDQSKVVRIDPNQVGHSAERVVD